MNKKIISLSAVIALLVTPILALAAIDPLTWIQTIISNLLKIVIIPLFSGIVILMLIYSAFLFVTAAGDPTKVSTAKKALIWAIVGIIVALVSYSVVAFLASILAVPVI